MKIDNPPEYLLGFGSVLKAMDPTYVDDFWNKPGYLGTEQSELGDLFQNEKVDFKSTTLEVNRDGQNKPISLLLDSAPLNELRDKSLYYWECKLRQCTQCHE